MNRMILSIVSGAALAASASGALVITEVSPRASAAAGSEINGDWWELTNTGPVSIDLSGYQWADTEDQLPSTDSNFFPSLVIAAGQSIIILEEDTANVAAWRVNWGLSDDIAVLAQDQMVDDSTPDGDTFSGLGSGGDAVFFYDAGGGLVSSYVYGATTQGVTFEADRFGNDLGLSVAGENGAFAAATGDIGSPGYAVPAPGAAALMTLAGVAGIRRRR